MAWNGYRTAEDSMHLTSPEIMRKITLNGISDAPIVNILSDAVDAIFLHENQ